ncbi:hypothetical protein EYF80_053775 [Liparis tanakae]|uniref:Uncharacterized protein n=1 Tax=Liparis tanakae TaxID=230148 RepID=A0A4Z2F584_9TELE|nr:hypothetical protein EYF80_053775 [Liparis tanakae]
MAFVSTEEQSVSGVLQHEDEPYSECRTKFRVTGPSAPPGPGSQVHQGRGLGVQSPLPPHRHPVPDLFPEAGGGAEGVARSWLRPPAAAPRAPPPAHGALRPPQVTQRLREESQLGRGDPLHLHQDHLEAESTGDHDDVINVQLRDRLIGCGGGVEQQEAAAGLDVLLHRVHDGFRRKERNCGYSRPAGDAVLSFCQQGALWLVSASRGRCG